MYVAACSACEFWTTRPHFDAAMEAAGEHAWGNPGHHCSVGPPRAPMTDDPADGLRRLRTDFR
jgi:hypothetical protein